MKKIITATCLIFLALITSTANAESGFKEPKTDEEWKSFCESPKYLEEVKKIKDRNQREKVSGTCLRTPWNRFKRSVPKHW